MKHVIPTALIAAAVLFGSYLIALSSNHGCQPWQTYQASYEPGPTRFGQPIVVKARCS